MHRATPKRRSWFVLLSASMLLATGCLAPEGAPGIEAGLSGEDSSEDIAEVEQSLKRIPLCQMPGTLGYHVAQATEDNPWIQAFNYNPTGDLVAGVAGEYNRKTGLFSWTETYHPDHYRTTTAVEGSLHVKAGKVVMAYTVETADIHGAAHVQQVEETWAGCAVTRRTRPAGAPDSEWRYHHGTYDGVAYTYDEQQAPSLWVPDPADASVPYANGTHVSSDMTWLESFSGYWASEEFAYGHVRKGDADGYVLTSWARAGSDYYQSGKDERLLDGTVHRTFHMDGADDSVDVETTVDYDGNGLGTMTLPAQDPGDSVTCALVLTATTCAQTCSNQAVPTICPWWVTK